MLKINNPRANEPAQLCIGQIQQKRPSNQLRVHFLSSRKGNQRRQATAKAQGSRAKPQLCTNVEDLPARYRVSIPLHCLLFSVLSSIAELLCVSLCILHLLSSCAGDSS